MAYSLARFFGAIASGGRIGVLADWRTRLGDDWERHADVFRVARRPVETIPCRTPCGHGCWREVLYGSDGVALAFCPEPDAAEAAYPLTADDLRQMQWEPERVAEKVSDALARYDGSGPGRAEASGIDKVWRIAWSPSSAWLLLEPGRYFWPATLERMLLEIRAPGRLLLPVDGMITSGMKRIFQDRGWTVSALDRLLAMDEHGDWHFVGRLPELPHASPPSNYAAIASPNVVDPEPAYSFVCLGATWEMVFNGERFSISHSKGCLALAILLENPGRAFHPLELEAVMDGRADARGRAGVAEMVDKASLDETRRRFEELNALVDQENDPAVVAEAREELAALAIHHRAVEGIGGRSRPVPDEGDGARKRLGKVISAALRAISSRNADARRHFTHISPNSFNVAYRPNGLIFWRVER